MHALSAKEMVRFGWNTFKQRPWFFVGLTLAIFVLGWVISFLQGILEAGLGSDGLGSMIPFVVGFLLNTLIGIGTIAVYLKAHDSLESVQIQDLWHPHLYLWYLAVSVLVGAAVMLGLILLIVPGIIAGLMFQFAPYLVVDRGHTPIDAMKASKKLTDGHKWELFVLGLLLLLINIAGAICLLVGLFVSVPVSYLAIAHAYRTLSSHSHPHA